MKKIYYLIATAFMALTITSCEDVPSPYGEPTNPNATASVDPAGTGSADDPFNIAAAIAKCKEVGATESSTKFYVKGYAASAATADAQYGNVSFDMSDSPDGKGKKFKAYQAAGPDGKKLPEGYQINVGDEVIIYGPIYNYNGSTPETAGKGAAWIVSVNGGKPGEGGGETGETIGTKEAPISVAEALTMINALDNGGKTENKAYVKGKVVKVTTNQANFEKYGNLNYYISEDGQDNNTIQVYSGDGLEGAKFSSITDIAAGDEVIVFGTLYKYVNANSGAVTPEIDKGNYLVSLVKGSGVTPTPSGDAKAATIAEFNAAAVSNDVWYQLTGTVKNLKDGDQYGNFDLEDETGSVYVYGLLSEKGGEKKKFQELVAAKGIKEGSKITIIGTRGEYNGKIEVMNAYFVSIDNSGSSGSGGESSVKAVSVADFNAAAVSNDVWYQLTGTVKNLKDGDQYGNFDLVDETGTVYVYGLLSEKGGEKKKFQELVAAKGIKEGSKITIIGTRGEYNGKIEVMNAYFVSIDNSGSSGSGGESSVKAVSVADFNAAAVSTDVWYQLTGKVKNLKDGDQYGNFDLEDSTGSVYVYGLLAEKGGEKKKFQDLVSAKGITEGSTITIIGNRGEYNGKIEVMNAYFVSIK